MKRMRILVLFGFGLLLAGCMVDDPENPISVYPMYVDDNSDNINDFVQQPTHQSGDAVSAINTSPMGQRFAISGHAFHDADEDGICDYAQNGGPTWHGPGYVDENNNGFCDYWDTAHAMHNRHQGMRYQDLDGNGINDHLEERTHWGNGHDFVDENGDGICDLGQDGSPTWHGPGFMDDDGNGICDQWEEGGMGNAHTMGGHGPHH
jgi:hypothetical protein